MTEANAKALFDKTKQKIINKVGRRAMDNVQVHNIGESLFGGKFLGVFPVDRVPLSKSGYAIINTDVSGNPGIHWVGFIRKGNKAYIFDSFARKGSKILKILTDRLNAKNIQIINSDLSDHEQRGKSQVCGQLSLSWLQVAHTMGIKSAILI
jgi:hypothetical protein